MRHDFSRRFRHPGAIIFSLFVLFCSFGISLPAQTEDSKYDIPALPIDPSVRMGVLDNGMTYILRRNETTEKGKANFYLVCKTGSLRERDGEEGMAHFIEKMAYGGTLHFSGDKLVDFFKRNGLVGADKLGSETFYDRTIYRIEDASTARQSFADSLILILRDWAGGMLLTPQSVSETKTNILGSWTSFVTPQEALRAKTIAELLPEGHLYARRPPFGTKASVEAFTPEMATAFYKKWYRPSNQAVIIVGDIDLDKTEEAIEQVMKYSGSRDKSAVPEPVFIPELDAPKGVVLSSPMIHRSELTISWISKSLPPAIASSAASLLKDYYIRLITLMLNERLKDLAFLPEPPFESAEIGYGPYLGLATNEDALCLKASLITGSDYDDALKALITEVKRAVEHGFTHAEFDFAKRRIIEEYDLRFTKLKETSNKYFADKYAAYFVSGGYIPGIELEQKLVSRISEQVTLKDVNDNLQSIISGPNTSILLTLPEGGTGILTPSGTRLASMYRHDYDKATEPYTPIVIPDTLYVKVPEPRGYLLSEDRNLEYGATRWRLSNGATVYLLPTKNSLGEVVIKSVAEGGFILADAQKTPIAVQAINNGLLRELGLGVYPPLVLKKFVDNSTIRLESSMRLTEDLVQGRALKKDLPDLFKLLYLRLSRPRFKEEDFSRAKNIELRYLRSSEYRPAPDAVLKDSLRRAMYPDQKVYGTFVERDLAKFKLQDLEQVYDNHYGDASRMTFFIVGDFEPAEIQPLVERYLASLPSDFGAEREKGYVPQGFPTRSTYMRVTSEGSSRDAGSTNVFVGTAKRTLKNAIIYELISDVILRRYSRMVATEEVLSRDFGVRSSVTDWSPGGSSYVTFSLHADPSHIDSVTDNIIGRIKSLAVNGIEEDDFRGAVQHLEETHAKDLRDNGFMTEALQAFFLKNEDRTKDYLSILKSITRDETNEALRDLVNHNVLVQVKVVSQGLPEEARQ